MGSYFNAVPCTCCISVPYVSHSYRIRKVGRCRVVVVVMSGHWGGKGMWCVFVGVCVGVCVGVRGGGEGIFLMVFSLTKTFLVFSL